MRRLIGFLILGVVTISLLTTACAREAPAPTPTPTLTTTPTEVITLKFGTWTTPTGAFGEALQWYLKEVETRSKGRIKFERYWSDSLVPMAQLLDALEAGIGDVNTINHNHYPGKIPLATVGSLPCFIVKDSWAASKAYADLYTQVPAMSAELAKYKARFLAPMAFAPFNLISVPPVKTVADLKGLKIHAKGLDAAVVKALGATPVSMSVAEYYEAMQRGTIGGVVSSPAGVATYKLQEVGKYFWTMPLSLTAFCLAISERSWGKLPKDLQSIMSEVGGEFPDVFYRIHDLEGGVEAFKVMKAAGVTINEPLEKDLTEVRELVRGVTLKKWVEDINTQGLPGAQVLETYTSLLKKYEPLNPSKK